MEPLHYEHFALSKIYLCNGFVAEEDEVYGRLVEFERLDELENTIRVALAKSPVRFNGAHLRYLRHGLEWTQRDFSKALEVSEQTVARWEKSDAALPKLVELGVRTLFLSERKRSINGSELWAAANSPGVEASGRYLFRLNDQEWTYTFEPIYIRQAEFSEVVFMSEDVESDFHSVAQAVKVSKAVRIERELSVASQPVTIVRNSSLIFTTFEGNHER